MEWKQYPGNPKYEVSQNGQVRYVGKTAHRRPSVTPTGYHVITTCENGRAKGRYVHKMVLETFVGECPSGLQVSHLNGNPADNRLENLAYETPMENHARKLEHKTDFNGSKNPAAKITEQEAREIRESTESQRALAKRYRISRGSIGRIKRGEAWRFV